MIRFPNRILTCAIAAALLALAKPILAQQARDFSATMRAVPEYEQTQLVGRWFEIARSTSRLEPNCQGVTADVEAREDSRLTLKIDCFVGSIDGPLLEIDGILVELAPAVFGLRLVRFREFGNLTIAVLWHAADGSVVVLGAPGGEIGWIWSRSAQIDPTILDVARAKLVEAGYYESMIVMVDQQG